MNIKYVDFDVEIGQGVGGDYPVAVRSASGEAHGVMRLPFGPLELDNHLLRLQNALLRSGGERRQNALPDQADVQVLGQALFDALLAGDIRSRYEVSQEQVRRQPNTGLRLRLHVQAPDLGALPWEYLYSRDRAEYVCLSRYTPVVRYLNLPLPPEPLSVTPPLRILGVIASPSDLKPLNTAVERQRLETALASLRSAGLVDLQWLPGQTWRDLQRALRGGPWHVLHFIGHGGFDRRLDEGVVALADEAGCAHPLCATDFARLLSNHRPLRLIVLNSCEGARGSSLDVFSSTASILVRGGIPAVVAMQYEITDYAAIELSRTFYDSIADGWPVDASLAEARVAISMAVPNTIEWGTPVLYTRASDGVLFNFAGRRDQVSSITEKRTSFAPFEMPPVVAVPPPKAGQQEAQPVKQTSWVPDAPARRATSDKPKQAIAVLPASATARPVPQKTQVPGQGVEARRWVWIAGMFLGLAVLSMVIARLSPDAWMALAFATLFCWFLAYVSIMISAIKGARSFTLWGITGILVALLIIELVLSFVSAVMPSSLVFTCAPQLLGVGWSALAAIVATQKGN